MSAGGVGDRERKETSESDSSAGGELSGELGPLPSREQSMVVKGKGKEG